MRVVFMGTPDFSVPALEAIHAKHEVLAVYTQPPRPAGRGKKDRPSPVQERAEKFGLEVRHPASLRAPETQAAFAELGADVAVVVAYGLILPQAVFDAPTYGCLNIHASLLPRWRGAAPIHRAIMAGDEETGICIMQMDAGLDTGPVLLRRSTAIQPDATTGALHDTLSEMGAIAIAEALARLTELTPEPQPATGVTYAEKIDKSEARINWSRPATQIDRQIRGLSPFPGAWCERDGERLKLLGSTLADGTGAPGEVLDEALTVACGSGAIRITRLQRAGKGAQDAVEFQRGAQIPRGARLT
jgi:methionyl-tRNA formyltransferase